MTARKFAETAEGRRDEPSSKAEGEDAEYRPRPK